MTKRVATLLAFAVALIGGAAIAQKNVTLSLKLQRLEGKAQDFLFDATGITIDNNAMWTPHQNSEGDAPELEFTDGEPKTLSIELAFDGFEQKVNVHDKFVQPLEGLTAVDPDLHRPPMVSVSFPQQTHLGAFTGVVSSVSTKYTMFLPDGTPCRCTTTISMKKASAASIKKQSPCP
jgi:hypothetical protein